jgi:hypothetical protein
LIDLVKLIFTIKKGGMGHGSENEGGKGKSKNTKDTYHNKKIFFDNTTPL